jgi:predicted secreted hydrolase
VLAVLLGAGAAAALAATRPPVRSGTAAALAATPPPVRPVVLPRDHGAHPGFGVEWWYTAGTVVDGRGRPYFWFATAWTSGMGTIGRVNVVDLRRDRIVLAHEYVALTHVTAGQRRIRAGDFALGWRPSGRWGRWSVAATTGGGSLSLALRPGRAYVLNGRHGIIRQGAGGPSAYYSQPRLYARGVLDLHGRRIAVKGVGWLDHQWGNFTGSVGALRWNWFACQLADGRDLMLYQFLNAADRPSGIRAGTLVTRAGRVRHLTGFTAVGRGRYIRPAGAQTTYPLRWRVSVPAAHLNLSIRARARNQFIVNTLVPSFWEGAETITHGPTGRCIVESSRQAPAF